VKTKSFFFSKDNENLKEKGEHSKKIENKRENIKNIKDNERKHNRVYQYKYTHERNKNSHQGNKDIFNAQLSNKIYFRGQDD
jgi:hypothetical protein